MRCVLAALVMSWSCAVGWGAEWRGAGGYRVIVEVEPVELGERKSDELVARLRFDPGVWKGVVPGGRAIDFERVQVMRLDAAGAAEKYGKWMYAMGEADRPFQFYDADYPEVLGDYEGYFSLDALAGRTTKRIKKVAEGVRHFNAVGGGRAGRLVWPHTQEGGAAARYAVYFDLLPEGRAAMSPPAGWVGDGSSRFVRDSRLIGPPGNLKGRAYDWNKDGLADLMLGSAVGFIVLQLNEGKAGAPAFGTKRLACDERGEPIDVGYDSCPWVTDWDGDGKPDLLVGAEKGCVLFYRNVGGPDELRFKYGGYLTSGGKMILTPGSPIAEGRVQEAYKDDYFPLVCTADWDGDGDEDLLLGGYVTGLIFYYENAGRGADGLPVLVHRGPMEADGTVIDTGWMAAPLAVDIDSDGDLDLICGAKPVSAKGGDTADASRALCYFENIGTRRAPKLVQRPFPGTGLPPYGGMTVPSVTDFDGDGVSDLVVIISTHQVFFHRNVGTARQPRFEMAVKPTGGRWQPEPLSFDQFIDYNGDGHLDALKSFLVMPGSGAPSPGGFGRRIDFRAGKVIKHPVPHGDENPGIILVDFDGDGDMDCLYGAHSGHIWYHENRGTRDKSEPDVEGRMLPLVGGGFIKVGLPEGVTPEKFDFTVMQGARPRPVAADFNRDGLNDLVIGDTYGKVRYYENRGTKGEPVFAAPVEIADLRGRLFVSVMDYNGDGWPDFAVLLGGIRMFINKAVPGRCEFEPPVRIEPPMPLGYLISFTAVDWNGDGDDDLLYHSATGLTCFAEGSFLKHGYREARVVKVEKRR